MERHSQQAVTQQQVQHGDAKLGRNYSVLGKSVQHRHHCEAHANKDSFDLLTPMKVPWTCGTRTSVSQWHTAQQHFKFNLKQNQFSGCLFFSSIVFTGKSDFDLKLINCPALFYSKRPEVKSPSQSRPVSWSTCVYYSTAVHDENAF